MTVTTYKLLRALVGLEAGRSCRSLRRIDPRHGSVRPERRRVPVMPALAVSRRGRGQSEGRSDGERTDRSSRGGTAPDPDRANGARGSLGGRRSHGQSARRRSGSDRAAVPLRPGRGLGLRTLGSDRHGADAIDQDTVEVLDRGFLALDGAGLRPLGRQRRPRLVRPPQDEMDESRRRR